MIESAHFLRGDEDRAPFAEPHLRYGRRGNSREPLWVHQSDSELEDEFQVRRINPSACRVFQVVLLADMGERPEGMTIRSPSLTIVVKNHVIVRLLLTPQ